MSLDLQNEVVLITGGSRGIGFETAVALGKAGAKVVLCARGKGSLSEAGTRLQKMGIANTTVCVDLTEKDSGQQVIQQVIGIWGQLDVLVNNMGGLSQTGDFMSLTDEDWYEAFNLNVLSAVRCCRAAIPYLRKSKNPRIINVSSVVAKLPGLMNPHYSACKTALLNLTQHLANVLAPDQILVNSVTPGIIQTEGWHDYLKQKAQQEGKPLEEVAGIENTRAAKSAPLGRMGTAKEIASLILYLASPASSFVTGANFAVDGGKAARA